MNKRKEQLDVVLDIDGVIADFEGFFCHRFGWDNRHMVNLQERYPERAGEIMGFIEDRATYHMLMPEKTGIQIAKWLMQRVNVYGRRSNRAKVTLLTSRPFRTYEITKKWLKSENVPYHQLEFSHNKGAWMQARQPDIIVDDIIDICEGAALTVPGVTPILMAHDWNEDSTFIPRITTLSQFQRIYQKVALEKLLDDIDGVGVAEDILSP